MIVIVNLNKYPNRMDSDHNYSLCFNFTAIYNSFFILISPLFGVIGFQILCLPLSLNVMN